MKDDESKKDKANENELKKEISTQLCKHAGTLWTTMCVSTGRRSVNLNDLPNHMADCCFVESFCCMVFKGSSLLLAPSHKMFSLPPTLLILRDIAIFNKSHNFYNKTTTLPSTIKI